MDQLEEYLQDEIIPVLELWKLSSGRFRVRFGYLIQENTGCFDTFFNCFVNLQLKNAQTNQPRNEFTAKTCVEVGNL